jgi:hypothetical protein
MFRIIERYLEKMALRKKIEAIERDLALVPLRDDLSEEQKASETLYLLKRLQSLKDKLKN